MVNEYFLNKANAPDHTVLDIGCGNGNLAHYLDKNQYYGNYLGVDGSSELLKFSGEKSPSTHLIPLFQVLDITSSDWASQLPDPKYDQIVSFAVFHHIPGVDLRLDIYRKINRLLPAGGLFIHSNWQFMNSQKLSKRIIPWEMIGLSSSQVDPGDALLDWRAEDGKTGYRYAHNFSEEELRNYALQANFHVLDSFYSDGSSGNLALYQVWQAD